MTTPTTHYDLAIAGAGAVGLATALWAQGSGLSVALMDRGEPGSGASFGNAGTIATYACTPVNSPSVFSSMPTLLFNSDKLAMTWSTESIAPQIKAELEWDVMPLPIKRLFDGRSP